MWKKPGWKSSRNSTRTSTDRTKQSNQRHRFSSARASRVGGISVFEPPPSETPSTKLQAPEKFQISKHQLQKQMPAQPRAARCLSLELGASLELGVWNWALFVWVFPFTAVTY